jgi:hypothetical protein
MVVNNMGKENSSTKHYIWGTVVLFSVILIVLISLVVTKQHVSGKCIVDIEYRDLTLLNNTYCYGDFSDSFCPTPTHIECEGSMDVNAMFVSMMSRLE